MDDRNAGDGRRTPLYEQIADRIQSDLERRLLRPHDPVPSEGEWAKLYGVSRMTTKLALDLLAAQGRVYRHARRGTFLAGEAAPSAPPSASRPQEAAAGAKRIAMVFPNVDDYTARIIAAAEEEARKSKCHLLVRLSKGEEDENDCLRELRENRVEGIILYPRNRTACGEAVRELAEQRFPLVVIDRGVLDVRVDCVYHDHYEGMYALTEYLIHRGHKRIGYVSMPFDGVTSREDRYRGYVRAMADNRLPVGLGAMLLHCPEDYMRDLSAPNPHLRAYLLNNRDLTAAACADDYLAASCLYTARSLNRPVPDALSIVGFSDIQLSGLLPVPLTTARQTTAQLAKTAVGLLLKRMGKSRENAVTVTIKTTIVERGSVRTLEEWGEPTACPSLIRTEDN